MDRRRILLIAAVIVALIGTALVFLYVRGADNRAEDRFEAVNVLKAVAPIEPGESIDDAAEGGKLALQPVSQADLLPNHQTTTTELSGLVALTRIYPGEQIISDKFGGQVDEIPSVLQIPKDMTAVAISLSDTGRVAGFVNPGSEVVIFFNFADPQSGQVTTRVLLPKVKVLGVGSTTTTTTTTTTAEGEQVQEQLPRTLMTLALNQRDAQKVLFAQGSGELAFGLLTGETEMNPNLPGANAGNIFQ
jgi:pilus assembly protein CpaB